MVWMVLAALAVGVLCLSAMEVRILQWIAVIFPLAGVIAFSRLVSGPLVPKHGALFGLLCGLPLAIQFLAASPTMVSQIRKGIGLARTQPVTYLLSRAEALKADNRPVGDPEQAGILQDLAIMNAGSNKAEIARITRKLTEAADTAEKNLWITMGLGSLFPLLPFALLGLVGAWIAKKLHPAGRSL